MSIKGDALFKVGKVIFSGVAILEALLLLSVAWFSLQFDDDEDVLRTKTHLDSLDIVEAGVIVAVAITLALGGVAAWNKSLPGRRFLVVAAIIGLLLFNLPWVLNALGVVNIYFG